MCTMLFNLTSYCLFDSLFVFRSSILRSTKEDYDSRKSGCIVLKRKYYYDKSCPDFRKRIDSILGTANDAF